MSRNITIAPYPQLPVQYAIYVEVLGGRSDPPMAGYAFITADVVQEERPVKQALLWHIFVDKDYRRSRFAMCLMAAIKHTYDRIITQAQTDNGALLLKACGFHRKGNFLVWEKTPTFTSTIKSVNAENHTGHAAESATVAE
jgi:GNAT superfamily N-acetyltransferase